MPKVDILVPVHDASAKSLQSCLIPSLQKFGDDVRLTTIHNAESAFHAYKILSDGKNNDPSAAPILVFTHADVEILDENFIKKLESVFSGNDRVGIVGVIGALSDTRGMWWAAKRKAGKVMWGQSPLDFGNMPGNYRTDAVLVDGLFLATNRHIKWDIETYGSRCWHIYDLDVCRQIHARNLQVAIADIEIRHTSCGRSDYAKALAKYRQKWRL
jgi:hypothetical protein